MSHQYVYTTSYNFEDTKPKQDLAVISILVLYSFTKRVYFQRALQNRCFAQPLYFREFEILIYN